MRKNGKTRSQFESQTGESLDDEPEIEQVYSFTRRRLEQLLTSTAEMAHFYIDTVGKSPPAAIREAVRNVFSTFDSLSVALEPKAKKDRK